MLALIRSPTDVGARLRATAPDDTKSPEERTALRAGGLLHPLSCAHREPRSRQYIVQPDATPHQRAREWVARRRIELPEPAPHAAMLVARHEHRPMPAGTTLAVQHAHVAGQQHLESRIARAAAQVEILAMQEVAFVKTAECFENLARQ